MGIRDVNMYLRDYNVVPFNGFLAAIPKAPEQSTDLMYNRGSHIKYPCILLLKRLLMNLARYILC